MEPVKDAGSIDNTDTNKGCAGQDNVQKWGFWCSATQYLESALERLFSSLVALLVADPETAKSALDGIKWKVIGNFDGFFKGKQHLCYFVCPHCLPYGKIRIGGNDASRAPRPILDAQMLFAAGRYWFDVLGCCRASGYFTGWYENATRCWSLFSLKRLSWRSAQLSTTGLHGWAIYVVALAPLFHLQ